MFDFLTKDAPCFDPADIKDNKEVSGIAYLWILFFLPLVTCPSSYYGRYNANQGLILFLLGIIVTGVFGVLTKLPFIGWLFVIPMSLYGLAWTVLSIICLVLTIQGIAVKIPVIGDITLIK